ncbi:hypothetical protein BC832DRAFT_549338 [Gaertneriomyces semiglobifer]|nr:hypothetical protein BC832DRAFT_549338 [Gaertneriomyces semiglobifer]
MAVKKPRSHPGLTSTGEEIPPILSQRFRRRAALLTKSIKTQLDDTVPTTPATPERRGTTIDLKEKEESSERLTSLPSIIKASGGQPLTTAAGRSRATSIVDRVTGPGTIAGSHSIDHIPPRSAKRRSQSPDVEADVAPAYQPFALAESSSFSPSSLSPQKLKQLPRTVIAKYKAYAAPDQPIAVNIERSARRARIRERVEKSRYREIIREARAHWSNFDEREEFGKAMARESQERMRRKINMAMAFRVRLTRNRRLHVQAHSFTPPRKQSCSCWSRVKGMRLMPSA